MRPSRMLKKSAGTKKVEVQAKVEIMEVSSLNLDLSLPRLLRPCWTNCLSILRLQGEARICENWALGQSRNGNCIP
jgi:hypothetical protein